MATHSRSVMVLVLLVLALFLAFPGGAAQNETVSGLPEAPGGQENETANTTGGDTGNVTTNETSTTPVENETEAQNATTPPLDAGSGWFYTYLPYPMIIVVILALFYLLHWFLPRKKGKSPEPTEEDTKGEEDGTGSEPGAAPPETSEGGDAHEP